MAFDAASLLRVTAQDLVNGLQKEAGNMADQLCTKKTRKAVRGTEPYRASVETLGKSLGAKAIGADPTLINQSLQSVNYDMERYSFSVALDESEIVDLEQYMEPLGEMTRTLVDYVDVAMEVDLFTLMTDSGSNGQHAAGNGAWSADTSTPILDLQEAKRLDAPMADTVVLGITSAYELARHPDVTAKVFNYSGGGAISFSALKGVVAEALGISAASVFIWETIYNSANFGQAVSLARVAEDFCWMGQKNGLLMFEQEGSGQITTETNHLKTELAYSRTADFIRVDTFLGTEITGL